jgi:hypothetical protein
MGETKYIQNLNLKNPNERDHLKDQGLDGRIMKK